MIRRSLSFSIYHGIMHVDREKHNPKERYAGKKILIQDFGILQTDKLAMYIWCHTRFESKVADNKNTRLCLC